ncbi:MAG: MCE family protein [Chlamydiales bacterium]|nr:MCE family protein [Chlamydiia bacterium]MCP5508124.1 MCE family protein [Chlamydiales bacterium]
MIDRGKNLMIGIFVIAAVTIVIFILLFLHPTVGDDGKILRVRFANIDKVNIGTRVTFGGKPVGEVVNIEEVIEEPNPRLPHKGQVYVYQLDLQVDSSVDVYNSDDVSLRTSGLLGEKSVNITPLPPKAGVKLRLVNDEIIYADESGSVEETFKEFKELSDKFEEALDILIDALHQAKEENLVGKIASTFANLSEITEAINKPEELGQIVDNARDITKSGKTVLAQVEEGKGTIGKLVMSDDLYLRLTSIFNKGETVMNDINHYGVLFHLDKNWQRLRARRLNLLAKLRTPQEFRNYFNDEMDQIATSLSRVGMILGKDECQSGCSIIYNCEFSKAFAELLRRVEGVEESLKMYNTQLNDCKVRETEFCDPLCE